MDQQLNETEKRLADTFAELRRQCLGRMDSCEEKS